MRNKHESPLLRLPGEIRNEIYAYVLGNKHYCVATSNHIDHDTGQTLSPNGFLTSSKDLALLTVCRQIHTEAHLLPFVLNTFHYDKLSDMFGTGKILIDQQRAIQRIHVKCDLGLFSMVNAFLKVILGPEGLPFAFLMPSVRHVMIDTIIASEDLRRLRRWEGGKNSDTRATHFKALKTWMLRDSDGRLHVEWNEHFDDGEHDAAA
jgi:hypothetical protein